MDCNLFPLIVNLQIRWIVDLDLLELPVQWVLHSFPHDQTSPTSQQGPVMH